MLWVRYRLFTLALIHPHPTLPRRPRSELPIPELIETERSRLLHGLLIASLLATPFWIALGIVLYLVFR